MIRRDRNVIVRHHSEGACQSYDIQLPGDACVRDVKLRLREMLSNKPSIETQTLIHGGQVLTDDTLLLEKLTAIGSSGNDSAQHMFLVLRSPQSKGSTTATENAASSAVPDTVSFQAEVRSPNAGAAQRSVVDTAFTAAYYAALESLRAQGNSRAPAANGNSLPSARRGTGQDISQPFFPAPVSFAPTLIPFPQLEPSLGHHQTSSSFQGNVQSMRMAAASSSQGSVPSSSAPPPHPLLSTLMAPALTYLPVSMGNAPQQGRLPRYSQQAYVHHLAAPAVPVMVPFGYNSAHQMPQQFEAPLRVHNTAPSAREPSQAPLGQQQPGGQRDILQDRPNAPVLRPVVIQGRPVQARVLQINMKLLLQVVLLAAVLWQSPPRGSSAHWLALAVAAFFLWPYLNQNNGLMRRLRGFLQRQPNPPAQGQEAGQARQAPARTGIIQETVMLIVGFVASLLPGFNMNADYAAQIAAAQRLAEQEAAAQQQNQQDDNNR